MQGSYRLKGPSLEEIMNRATAKYGPGARIVSAELVTNRGIAGLFAGSQYEAVVHVGASEEQGSPPRGVGDSAVPAPRAAHRLPSVTADGGAPGEKGRVRAGIESVSGGPHQLQRSAIAGLLAAADSTEARANSPLAASVSTESDDFAKVLEQFTALAPLSSTPGEEQSQNSIPAPHPGAGMPREPDSRSDALLRPAPQSRREARRVAARPRRSAPPALEGPGDLVILLGLGADALAVALEISSAAGGADVRTAGQLSAFGHLHVANRFDATAARAQAVENHQTVVLAYGLGKNAGDVQRAAALVAALRGDQVWAVVDAGRKPADSQAWLQNLRACLDVSAIVALGLAGTGSPESILDLGLPVSDEYSRE